MSDQPPLLQGAPPDSRSNGVLGYIRFKEQTGTIELTNFRAALTRAYLSLGCTTKRKDNGQFAGSHGEGFKLAALVMCRDGYSVRYSTTSRYWNFCFRGYEDACEFCCNISAPKEEKLNKDKKLAFLNSGTKKEQLEAHAWEDVSVQIRVRGGKLKDKISKKDFEEWTRSALELNPPSSIISTENGDVIFDKQYAGQLYLRGLLLPAGKTILNCKYGYNLHHGKINRDRESLADRNEEAQQIALIWDTAIKQSPDSAVERYAQLLRSHIPLGDVTRAEQCVTKAAACSVWTFLLSLAGKDVFYYHERNDDAVYSMTCIMAQHSKLTSRRMMLSLFVNICKRLQYHCQEHYGGFYVTSALCGHRRSSGFTFLNILDNPLFLAPHLHKMW